jgi:hypothetical protein
MTSGTRASWALWLLLLACSACANPRPRPADALAVRLDVALRALDEAEHSYEQGREDPVLRGREPELSALRVALSDAQLSSLYAEYAIAQFGRGDARAWNALRACLARDLQRVDERLAALQLASTPGLTQIIEPIDGERCDLDLVRGSARYLQHAQAASSDLLQNH